MTDNVYPLLMVPQGVMRECAIRVRELRIRRNITQKELAERVGVAEGTIKRFEHTGEVQFRTLPGIPVVKGRLEDFTGLFKIPDVPTSLCRPEPENPRRRARKK